MRRYFLLLLLSVLVSAGYSQKHQTQKPLTDKERKEYILSINQQKLDRKSDKYTSTGESGYASIPIILFNNSSDTLTFLQMTCSWQEIFTTNNVNIGVNATENCDSNFPRNIKVAPHKQYIVVLSLLLKVGQRDLNYKFKLGMCLYSVTKAGEDELIRNKKPKNRILWSNEVEVQKFL